jgi:hypothetical protein
VRPSEHGGRDGEGKHRSADDGANLHRKMMTAVPAERAAAARTGITLNGDFTAF